MKDVQLEELVQATRDVDRPAGKRADALFERIAVSAAAGMATSTATQTAEAASQSAAGGQPATLASATSGAGAKWTIVALFSGALGAGAWGTGLLSTPSETAPKSSSAIPSSSPPAPDLEERGVTDAPKEPSSVPDESKEPTGTPPVEARRTSPLSQTKSSRGGTSQDGGTEKEKPRSDLLSKEVALIRQAKVALNAKNPGRALTLLAEYDRQFPTGTLRAEAQATRVLAYCAMNRGTNAEDAAKKLDANSPLGKKMLTGCPTGKP